MCPEKEILSVYFDGELPSPWKEKLESHVAACPACASALESYGAISEKMSDDHIPTQEVRDRVLTTIHARQDLPQALRSSLGPAAHRFPMRNLYRGRSVSVPLPAIAAAAALFVVAITLLVARPPSQNNAAASNAAIAARDNANIRVDTGIREINFDAPDMREATSLSDVLKYFENDDSRDILIMRLPENRLYKNFGEPAIINASDSGGGKGGLRE
jgi:hypothetical protein